MHWSWTHLGTSAAAAFFASLVECVEALTVVLAVGSVRGWRSALLGCATALVALLALVLALGKALLRLPLGTLQLAVGVLLVLFGLRWLRKAVLRAAGLIPLHDEGAAFRKTTAAAQRSLKDPSADGFGNSSQNGSWDQVAFLTSFNITMLEGIEVVFIVVAISAGSPGMLLPAGLGAAAALLAVAALGVALHRPLANVPENALKFLVGTLLSAFGTFWVGEGLHLGWPGEDWSILGLIAAYLVLALVSIPLCRRAASPARS